MDFRHITLFRKILVCHRVKIPTYRSDGNLSANGFEHDWNLSFRGVT